jgi:uncharacterized protein (DUF697 family)
MPPKRPEFNLPSTKLAARKKAKPEWVYRSDSGESNNAAPALLEPVEGADRSLVSRFTVERYAKYSGVAGFIPVPFFDVIAIGSVQLKMIAELCAIYGVAFNNEVGKSLIAALVGSVGATRLAYELGGSFLRAIPIVGAISSVLAMPAVGYGATWAIGKVFMMHFESGGTLLDVNVTKMRANFKKELAE